ncbi:uncharacterized protein VP01_6183g1, partial [Puccinia sorghi]
ETCGLYSIAAFSCPMKPLLTDWDPREARQLDKGVCKIAPPQFEFFFVFIVPCLSWPALFSPGNLDRHQNFKTSASRRLNPRLSRYTVKNDLLFHRHRIMEQRNSELQTEIIQIHHDSKLAGHPGRCGTTLRGVELGGEIDNYTTKNVS